VSQSRLTEANLLKLDKEILEALKGGKEKPAEVAPKPEKVARPQTSSSKASHKQEDDKKRPIESLVKSIRKEPLDDNLELEDNLDDRSQKIDYNEDKDWDAILKFNNDLYQEELRQEEDKKYHQKKFIKSELDKQAIEKRELTSKEREEVEAYQSLQKTHLRFLEQKEKDKEEQMRLSKKAEKERLDKQMKEEMTK
jgi:hypothetical protein